MEIRKPLLAFRTLLKSIKLFKSEVIPSKEELDTWEYKDDMQMLTTRYLLLTEDREFQEKLKELYYLETCMIQIRCINDIQPVFFLTTPSKDTYVYVRGSFLTEGHIYQLARSIGKETHYPMRVRSMDKDPGMMAIAHRVLGVEMRNRMILDIYKFKYDVANRKDA